MTKKGKFFTIIFIFSMTLAFVFAIIGLTNYVKKVNNESDIVASASSQISDLKEDLSELYVSRSDFEIEKGVLEYRISQVETPNSDLKERLIEVENKIVEINSKISIIEYQIDLLTDLVNDLKNTGNMVPEKQQSKVNLSSSDFVKGNTLVTMSTNGYVILNLCSNMSHFYCVFWVLDENGSEIYSESIENYTQGYEVETRVFPMKKGWKINIGTVGADFSLYWGNLTIVEAN